MNIFRKLFDWYFNSRTLPYWCILLIDCAIVAFSMACGILADNSWTIAGVPRITVTYNLQIAAGMTSLPV